MATLCSQLTNTKRGYTIVTVIKNIFLFIVSVVIGIAVVILYVKITNGQETLQTNYQTPTSQPVSSFSLDNPPKDSLLGNIATMSGIIDWQSRVATQTAKLTDLRTQIVQGEMLQTGIGSSINVQFPTCCSLYMYPQTQLNFIQTLPANVVIQQTSGITEYVVTNSIPVAIRSLDLLTNINSGDILFSVSNTQPIITVFVKKGSMQASYNDLNYNSTVIPVYAGQTFYFNDQTREESVE